MKIKITPHATNRLNQRASSKKVVLSVFEQAIKLAKKKKLRPVKSINDKGQEALVLQYQACTFIYKKDHKGVYILITFYQRGTTKKGMDD